MSTLVYTKPDCPYCVKAKELLTERGISYTEIPMDKEVFEKQYGISVRTVPQVVMDGAVVGGYDELRSILFKRTVFNTKNTGHETKKYPLFLGEALGLTDTINTNYPILDNLFQKQMSQLWNEFEISLVQDRQDMLTAPQHVVDKMVKTISWQHIVDTVASRSITGILMEHVTNSELESWYNAVALFETIHAKTYSHIVKQTFINPNEMLERTYSDYKALERSGAIVKAFDDLANLPRNATREERIEAVVLVVVALYLLEAVAFMASFAVTFGIGEMGWFQGTTQDVVLICRDEILHARGGREVVKIISTKDFPTQYEKLKPKIKELFDEVMNQELDQASYLFSDGHSLSDLNEKLLKDYVCWLGKPIASSLGIDFSFPVIEKDPLPYMKKYIDSSRVQVAAQELQITSYLVNSIEFTDQVDHTLDALRYTILGEKSNCKNGVCSI